jgi:uncharacterized membrane protein (Fun14 family)
VIVLGLILLVVGFIIGFGLLETIGVILLVVGLILLLLGHTGHPMGNRNHWY